MAATSPKQPARGASDALPSLPPTHIPERHGVIADRYEISSELGKGGMGRVYVAHDRKLGRDVAVKMLAPGLPGQESILARFELEARAAASLNHPNIVAVHDVG